MSFDPVARQIAQNALNYVRQFIALSQDDPVARGLAQNALTLAEQSAAQVDNAMIVMDAANLAAANLAAINLATANLVAANTAATNLAAAHLAAGFSATPALFADIAGIAPGSGIQMLTTAGYSVLGIGGATYVADQLATAALATANPRCCTADSTGRFWRLIPVNGRIAISQAGALGSMANDQPMVQASIDYAKAIACREILFDFETVSLWTPIRTTSPTDPTISHYAPDGQCIWITAPIKFTGLPTRTHMLILSPTGGSRETGWQNVGGVLWRGDGINLIGGSQNVPNANNLTFFSMENIWLDGGCSHTGDRTQPATPAHPDGADLTDQGIRLQDTQCDAIYLVNCKIGGFKGETCYLAGTTNTIISMRHVEMYGSNQSGFNPSAGYVDAEDCYFHDTQGFEMLGRNGGRMSNCRFVNMAQASITGGPANGVEYNYGYPTHDSTVAPPWFDFINCEFVNVAQVLPGNYIRFILGRYTDTNFYLITGTALPGGVGSMTSTYITGVYTIDQISQNAICTIQGPPTLTTLIPGAPAGNYILPVSDVHIHLDVHRTAQARTNGLFAIGFTISGYFDQDTCSLAIGEADGLTTMVNALNNFGSPLLTFDGPTSSQHIGAGRPWGYYPYIISAGPSYAMTITNPRHALEYYGPATTIAITIAAPFTAPFGYVNGQRCRIWYGAQNTAGTILTLARNDPGLRLASNCHLSLYGDTIDLEFNVQTGLWHEIARSIYVA